MGCLHYFNFAKTTLFVFCWRAGGRLSLPASLGRGPSTSQPPWLRRLALPWEGSGVAGAASRLQRPALPQEYSPHGGGRSFYSSRPGPLPVQRRSSTSGWANIGTIKDHIDAHLSGNLRGEVPPEWLRTRCLVCGLSVSVQHGVHPTCQPGPPWGQSILQQPLRRRHFLRCRRSMEGGRRHSVTSQQQPATCVEQDAHPSLGSRCAPQ